MSKNKKNRFKSLPNPEPLRGAITTELKGVKPVNGKLYRIWISREHGDVQETLTLKKLKNIPVYGDVDIDEYAISVDCFSIVMKVGDDGDHHLVLYCDRIYWLHHESGVQFVPVEEVA